MKGYPLVYPVAAVLAAACFAHGLGPHHPVLGSDDGGDPPPAQNRH